MDIKIDSDCSMMEIADQLIEQLLGGTPAITCEWDTAIEAKYGKEMLERRIKWHVNTKKLTGIKGVKISWKRRLGHVFAVALDK